MLDSQVICVVRIPTDTGMGLHMHIYMQYGMCTFLVPT